MENLGNTSDLFKAWLTNKLFTGITTLIKEEVRFRIADFNLTADLIAIQSKSNRIHGFAFKPNIAKTNVASAFWECSSYYTNYRWLIIPLGTWSSIQTFEIGDQINSSAVGIITYDTVSDKFDIAKQAKYTDGNFLKFLPELEEEWITIVKQAKK